MLSYCMLSNIFLRGICRCNEAYLLMLIIILLKQGIF